MSLISDALKRARQEAARQDSLRQGVPYAVGVADSPVRRTPWISLLAGLGAGCILAAAVFALAFFAGWGPSRKPTIEARTAEIPAAVPQSPVAAPVAEITESVAPAPLPTVPPQEKAAPAPASKPAPELPRVAEERRPAPQVETTPPVVRRPPPETVPAAPAPAPIAEVERPAPAPVPAAPTSATLAENSGSLVEGQVYTGEVPVPGGGSLKLNGIVFSQDHPIAVLDGRVMGPGESVQGFTLVAIESGRVKLQGHGTTVYLSPK
jgi:hypothetical protein